MYNMCVLYTVHNIVLEGDSRGVICTICVYYILYIISYWKVTAEVACTLKFISDKRQILIIHRYGMYPCIIDGVYPCIP